MASDELPTEHYLLDCFPHYTCIMRDMGDGDDDGGDDGGNGGDDDRDGVGIKVVGDFSNITGKTRSSNKSVNDSES